MTYFNVKREIRKLLDIGRRAIRNLDSKLVSHLLIELDNLDDGLKTCEINSFGLYVLRKEIDGLRYLLTTELKRAKDKHETTRRKSTQSRNKNPSNDRKL